MNFFTDAKCTVRHHASGGGGGGGVKLGGNCSGAPLSQAGFPLSPLPASQVALGCALGSRATRQQLCNASACVSIVVGATAAACTEVRDLSPAAGVLGSGVPGACNPSPHAYGSGGGVYFTVTLADGSCAAAAERGEG